MESALFTRFEPDDTDSRHLREHLRMFLGLDEQGRDACVQSLQPLSLAPTAAEARTVVEQLHSKLGQSISMAELTRVVQMLDFFLTKMQDKKFAADTPEMWAADLIQVGFLSQPEKPILVSGLELLKAEILPNVRGELLKRNYGTGIFPCLKSVGVTVELRAVKEEKFEWGTSLDEYQPNIIDLVGVASIHIGVDAGPLDDFYFQADERRLGLLIESLQAAQRDLQALSKTVASGE